MMSLVVAPFMGAARNRFGSWSSLLLLRQQQQQQQQRATTTRTTTTGAAATTSTTTGAAATTIITTNLDKHQPSSPLGYSNSRRLQHNFAIAREIPNSFVHALSQHFEGNSSSIPTTTSSEASVVNLEIARQQHQIYIQELRKLIPVLLMPAEEEYPDCCFVEDTVIAVGNRALITNPGHASRRGEVNSVRMLLEQLGMEVIDMKDRTTPGLLEATCDGGDVMYTGRHLFVGVSNRTNEEALKIIEDVFPDVPLIPVPPNKAQGNHVLHLKSAVTHLDECTLLAPTDPMGYRVLRAMRADALGYNAVHLPNVLACNAVTVNGTILAQDDTTTPAACSTTRQHLMEITEKRGLNLVFVNTAELAKKDAALTCCSVLLSL